MYFIAQACFQPMKSFSSSIKTALIQIPFWCLRHLSHRADPTLRCACILRCQPPSSECPAASHRTSRSQTLAHTAGYRMETIARPRYTCWQIFLEKRASGGKSQDKRLVGKKADSAKLTWRQIFTVAAGVHQHVGLEGGIKLVVSAVAEQQSDDSGHVQPAEPPTCTVPVVEQYVGRPHLVWCEAKVLYSGILGLVPPEVVVVPLLGDATVAYEYINAQIKQKHFFI